jgi:hypothetical protein
MNKSKIVLLILLFSITNFCVALSVFGQSGKYQGNRNVKALTRDLPTVDKIELLKLEKKGDLWTGNIEATKFIEANEAQKFAKLWRQQNYHSMSASCHLPAYAVKFYSKGKLLAYATLCWDCNNINFEEPNLGNTQGFDGDSRKGQKLLQVFKTAFSEKK